MRIYLVGFMGSGKSYLGKLWAAANNLSFYDLDELIKQKENKIGNNNFQITDIFENKGEQYFRAIESQTLKETTQLNNAIIACGGGTACFNNNMTLMNENGTTVFLQATTDMLYKNLLPQKNKRPLLANINNNDLLAFIQQKLDERLHYYALSKVILNSEELNINGFQKILQSIKNA